MSVANLLACSTGSPSDDATVSNWKTLGKETSMGRLDDKVALITGASRGQGREMAELFMRENATAVYSADILDAAETEDSKVTFLKMDVTKSDQWKAVVDQVVAEHGRIDILINNAAICLYEPILETTDEIYDRVLDIDLKSIFYGMKRSCRTWSRRSGVRSSMSRRSGASPACRAPMPIRQRRARS